MIRHERADEQLTTCWEDRTEDEDDDASRARRAAVRTGPDVAAIVAVAIRALVDIPTVVILIPVVMIGFALSWHATGQALEDREP